MKIKSQSQRESQIYYAPRAIRIERTKGESLKVKIQFILNIMGTLVNICLYDLNNLVNQCNKLRK